MAISRALDSNNDLIIENGSLKLVRDAAEAIQHVRTRLLFYLEEWFLDTSAGTPWLQEVMVKPVNLANVESIIKTRIIQTPGVLTLQEFSMEYDTSSRRLNVQFTAETEYGEIEDGLEVTING